MNKDIIFHSAILFYSHPTLSNARLYIFSRLQYHCITAPDQFSKELSGRKKKIMNFAFAQLVKRGILGKTEGYFNEWLPKKIDYKLIA